VGFLSPHIAGIVRPNSDAM